jgi:hypothetical protein
MALDLNTSEMVAVYDRILLILRNDPTMKRVVKTWRSWRELPGQHGPFSTDSPLPAIRVTPVNGPEQWRYPHAMVGPLYLNFEILLLGSDVRDAMNLWRAMQIAIYPGGTGTFTNIQALQAAGANSGMAEFTVPAYDDTPDGANLLAKGQMKIDVKFNLPN